MDISEDCPLAATLAERLRGARDELTAHWLARITARVSLDPNRVFPTEDLLDHVPILIDGIANYLENPVNEVSADMPVVAKAMELGKLRYAQGFDAYEILKEYEILGGILFAFLIRLVDEIDEPCGRGELLICGQRLFRAVAIIQQTTTTHYLRAVAARVAEREDRLRRFNHTLTHELKNRIAAALGAGELALMEDLAADKRERMLAIVVRNVREMQARLDSLLELSRLDEDARHQRHIELPEAVKEVARQLRESVEASQIELRLADDLPRVEVNSAAVELCLMNYISNAIKYADPVKQDRWVEVRGSLHTGDDGAASEIILEVHDNGIGVPEESRAKLFERFFRAPEGAATGVEGTGLGLSIVRDTVQSLGGRAWADFSADGSVFAFALPCRREADATRAVEGAARVAT